MWSVPCGDVSCQGTRGAWSSGLSRPGSFSRRPPDALWWARAIVELMAYQPVQQPDRVRPSLDPGEQVGEGAVGGTRRSSMR